jgi:hypothetical protein
MDIVEMASKILLIANRVFPKSALPYPPRPLAHARMRPSLFDASFVEKGASEMRFDVSDSPGKIGVSIGQRHQNVEMIGKENNGFHNERMKDLASLNRVAKPVTCHFAGENRRSAFRHKGEKKRTARSNCPQVIGHEDVFIPNQRIGKR